MRCRHTLRSLAIATALSMSALPAAAQTVVVDRTGSLADQHGVESELTATLPAAALVFPAIRLVFFSDNVLQVKPIIVSFRTGPQSGFGNLQDAARLQTVREGRTQLQNAFSAPGPQSARASNIPAAILRTADDSRRGLLVTDGDNESPAPHGAVTRTPIFVVLCAAKRDTPANELVAYDQRRRQILTWAPNARVFPCFKLRTAVIEWAEPGPLAKAARDAR
jgi:hypothetical protein